MESLTIREFAASELDQAFVILRELREHLDFQTFAARLERQSEHGYRLFGAFAGTALIGLIGMRPVETMARGKHLHVDDLVVTARLRSKGTGAQMLAFAEKVAADNGLTVVFLDSRQEAIRFYERSGYGKHTATLMRKHVRQPK